MAPLCLTVRTYQARRNDGDMRYTIDAAAALTRLAEHARYLRGSETRLLVHLTALAVQAGSLEVTASENQLAACLHLGHGHMTKYKRRLAELGLVMYEGAERRGAGVWYLGYLRELVGTPVSGAGAPVLGAEGTPVSGAGTPVSGADVPPFRGQGTPVLGAGTPVSGAGAEPGHSPPAGPPAHARRSIEAVVTTGGFSSIDRVLTTKIWTEENDEAVGILARYLRSWAARDGAPGLAERTLDRQILAQCAAIGPIGVLENAWLAISARLGGYKVESWGFFVTALLAEVYGVTPTEVKARRDALRNQPRLVNGVASTSPRNLLLSKLVKGVKNLA